MSDADNDGYVSYSEDSAEGSDPDEEVSIISMLRHAIGRGNRASDRTPFQALNSTHPMPMAPSPLAVQLARSTSGINARRLDSLSLDSGRDAATKRVPDRIMLRPQAHADPNTPHGSHAAPLECLTCLPSALQGSNGLTLRSADLPASASDLSPTACCAITPPVKGIGVDDDRAGQESPSKRRNTGRRILPSGDGLGSITAPEGLLSGGRTRRRSARLHPGGASESSGHGRGSIDQTEAEANGTEPGEQRAQPRPRRVSRLQDLPPCGATEPCSARLLVKRELGLGDAPRFTRPQQVHLQCRTSALPVQPARLLEEHDARCYIGQFSVDGKYLIVACQDTHVRVYHVDGGAFTLVKDVQPRGVRWTVTDTVTSPDQRYLIYSSIHPTVHLVDLSRGGPVDSQANVTEVHEDLPFSSGRHSDGFGIWSIRWSKAAMQIIAGTNNESVYVYDPAENKVVARARGHDDDVNAVEYLDDMSPNMILTGSDDHLIKLWDRRLMDTHGHAPPVGVLVGHTEGITHLNAKGDGWHFISNAKDQAVKLWDVRVGLRSEREAAAVPSPPVEWRWDYRWMQYPGRGLDVYHPADASVMTYRGHQVTQTLIRAYWSPAATTGQRYIYSGSGDNAVHMWDALTGQEACTPLEWHRALIRDVTWHPTEPLLVTVGWDGCVVAWAPSAAVAEGWRGRRLMPPVWDPAGNATAVRAGRRARWPYD